jgi:hypothetical protein
MVSVITFSVTVDMTGRCFTTDVIKCNLHGKLPRWQRTICSGLGGGFTLSDQTTKGGENSIGTLQLGGPGFTSQKFSEANKIWP